MNSDVDPTSRALDTWMAMLAGDRVWHHEADEVPSALDRTVAGLMIAALAGTVLTQTLVLATRIDRLGTGSATRSELEGLTVGGILAAIALGVRPLQILRGRRSGPVPFWWSISWRGAAYLTLIVVTAAVLPRWRAIGSVPLGLAFGMDATLTMWALGLTPTPIEWARRMVWGTVHFGALGALIGATVFDPNGPSSGTALGLYLAMWMGLGTAATGVWLVNHLHRLIGEELADDRVEVRRKERELRVHWLHDDVLSEVKLASLRLEAGGDPDGTKRELQDLDHRLRLRQLEEILGGGSPHLYEIIQPHLRRAQTLGARIDRVPALDRTDRRVDEATGQLVHRALSILMSNALNVGGRHLALDLDALVDAPALLLSLTDDAGGFSLDDAPPGGGLKLLERDLGPGSVSRTDAPRGSTVSVRIPLSRPTTTRPEEVSA
jgi:hypothetical protein